MFLHFLLFYYVSFVFTSGRFAFPFFLLSFPIVFSPTNAGSPGKCHMCPTGRFPKRTQIASHAWPPDKCFLAFSFRKPCCVGSRCDGSPPERVGQIGHTKTWGCVLIVPSWVLLASFGVAEHSTPASHSRSSLQIRANQGHSIEPWPLGASLGFRACWPSARSARVHGEWKRALGVPTSSTRGVCIGCAHVSLMGLRPRPEEQEMYLYWQTALREFSGPPVVCLAADASRVGYKDRLCGPIMNLRTGITAWTCPQARTPQSALHPPHRSKERDK